MNAGQKLIGHISLGGDVLEIVVGGRTMTFEDHPQCGPTPVNPRTLAILSGNPSRAFWDAIERWVLSGKRTENGCAMVPQWCVRCRGDGFVGDAERGGDWIKTCPVCLGRKVSS